MTREEFFIKRVSRFFQIDLQYIIVGPGSFVDKIRGVIAVDVSIVINVLFRKMVFSSISTNGKKIYFDTLFCTKTFLAAIYDFFIESNTLSILPKKPVIVDVGANTGQFLIAAKSYFTDAKIYSFEPNPEAFNILKKNADQFHSVHLYNYALADRRKSITFYINKNLSEWSTVLKPKDPENFSKLNVQTDQLDSLLPKLSKIDLLKIDVEGAELAVLKGSIKTLKKSKYVMVEVSLMRESQDTGSSKTVMFLLKNNFRLFSIGRIFTYGAGYGQSAADVVFINNKINS